LPFSRRERTSRKLSAQNADDLAREAVELHPTIMALYKHSCNQGQDSATFITM
jgi:hypothetical protein